jgi:hypothetical protein
MSEATKYRYERYWIPGEPVCELELDEPPAVGSTVEVDGRAHHVAAVDGSLIRGWLVLPRDGGCGG